ncbi:hypothetical protein ABXW85_22805, partial [Streptococcus suis]
YFARQQAVFVNEWQRPGAGCDGGATLLQRRQACLSGLLLAGTACALPKICCTAIAQLTTGQTPRT